MSYTGSAIYLLLVPIIAAASPPLPTPDPDFLALGHYFQGRWHCAGHFSNGDGISSEETFEPLFNGLSLRESHADDPPHIYSADTVWSVDTGSKTLTVAIHDSFGGFRVFSAPDWQGGVQVFTSVPIIGPLKRSERFIYMRKTAQEFNLEYDVQSSTGEWKMGDTLVCSRSP